MIRGFQYLNEIIWKSLIQFCFFFCHYFQKEHEFYEALNNDVNADNHYVAHDWKKHDKMSNTCKIGNFLKNYKSIDNEVVDASKNTDIVLSNDVLEICKYQLNELKNTHNCDKSS